MSRDLPSNLPHPDGVAFSRWQMPPGPWTTVLEGLCARFTAIGRERWLERMARGLVLDAQGRAVTPSTPYRVGAEIRYRREVADEPSIPFDEIIVHADAHLLVVDKPHFLPVTPAGAYVSQTLLARLARRTGLTTLVPLHRIDRDTAGLVLFSCEPATRAAYQALFAQRRIHKRYQALAPALPDGHFPMERRTRLEAGTPFFRMRECEGEANSHTRIEVVERGPAHWRYALEPVTGRKHQLRVHMAALGAPILGDAFYPQLREPLLDDYAHPLKLLAHSLRFVDPLDRRERHFESQREL